MRITNEGKLINMNSENTEVKKNIKADNNGGYYTNGGWVIPVMLVAFGLLCAILVYIFRHIS